MATRLSSLRKLCWEKVWRSWDDMRGYCTSWLLGSNCTVKTNSVQNLTEFFLAVAHRNVSTEIDTGIGNLNVEKMILSATR